MKEIGITTTHVVAANGSNTIWELTYKLYVDEESLEPQELVFIQSAIVSGEPTISEMTYDIVEQEGD